MIDIYVRLMNGTWFGLAFCGKAIVATAVNPDRERTLRSLLRSLPPNAEYQVLQNSSGFAESTILKLEKTHLGGEDFGDFILASEHVGEPLASVLKTAATIPIGYVASYGSIAKAAGTEPKVVGQIMASNPLYPIVPCHRVVGADFSLVGYGGRKSAQALKAKLTRLSRECRGFKSPKEIPVAGKVFKVFPSERVIDKAKKQGLSTSDSHQRTLRSYESKRPS